MVRSKGNPVYDCIEAHALERCGDFSRFPDICLECSDALRKNDRSVSAVQVKDLNAGSYGFDCAIEG
jgi:hypothetical protein